MQDLVNTPASATHCTLAFMISKNLGPGLPFCSPSLLLFVWRWLEPIFDSFCWRVLPPLFSLSPCGRQGLGRRGQRSRDFYTPGSHPDTSSCPPALSRDSAHALPKEQGTPLTA